VNVVQSDKIGKPTSVAQPDGVQMSLPLSLGPKRLEKDKGGDALVPTFDACFHPDALALVRTNKQFKEYLITTALEHAEEAMHALKPQARSSHARHGKPAPTRDKVSKDYHILRGVAYKNGTPAIMMMAKEAFVAEPGAGGLTKAAAALASSAKAAAPRTAGAAAPEPPKAAAPKQTAAAGGKLSVSKGFLNKAELAPGKATPAASAAAMSQKKLPVSVLSSTPAPAPPPLPLPSPPTATAARGSGGGCGALEPTYAVTERGLFELAAHLNGRVAPPRRPRELEVCVQLPRLAQPSAMDLDVGDRRLRFTANRQAATTSVGANLKTAGGAAGGEEGSAGNAAAPAATYVLDLLLPYPCVGAKGKAKFDKVKKELRITIPVVASAHVSEEDLLGTPVPDEHEGAVTAVSGGEAKAGFTAGGSAGAGVPQAEKARGEEEAKTAKAPKALQAERDHARFLDRAAPVLASGRLAFDLPPGATLVAAPPPAPAPAAREAAARQRAQQDEAKAAGAAAASAATARASAQEARAAAPASAAGRFRAARPFTAAAAWGGPCPGFVFKLGGAGLGYYYEGGEVPSDDEAAEGDDEEDALEEGADEEIEAWVEAPFECKQLEAVVTVLVQVPYVDKASAAVTFDASGLVTVAVCSLPPPPPATAGGATAAAEGGSAAVVAVGGGTAKRFRVAWRGGGPLDAAKCRFDVADRNLVVVLFKASPGRLWETPLVVVPFPGAEAEAEQQAAAKAARGGSKATRVQAAKGAAAARTAAGTPVALAAEETIWPGASAAEQAAQAAADAAAAAAIAGARATEKAVLASQLELERAAARRSAAAASQPLGRAATGAMTSSLPLGHAALSPEPAYDEAAALRAAPGVDNGFGSTGGGVAAPGAAAPVAFQNAFMFELD
jgi:hypothetical protein